MALKILKKIDTKLQFLYRRNEFLNPKLRKLLCNSLIESQFGHACISWYPLVSRKMRKIYRLLFKMTCLKLNSRQQIEAKELKK